MNARDFFAAVAALPFGTLRDVTRGGGLVVVAPHPDDESLGCGGLIAEACAQGVPVRLVVVSDGVGSHPGSQKFPAPKLRALRETETCAAALALGLSGDAIHFLRLPDRAVPIEGPMADDARDAIVAAARQSEAGAVCVTWPHDPHCDHAASADLVLKARSRLRGARIFYYPIWGWTLPSNMDVGAPPRGVRFEMSRHVAAKTAAIAAHRSQTTALIDDDPNGFRLTAAMVGTFTGRYEILIEADATS